MDFFKGGIMFDQITSIIAIIISIVSLYFSIIRDKKELKKSLHNEIYTKIYLPFFEQIQRVYSLHPNNHPSIEIVNPFNDYYKNLDYARFFINEKDYKKMIKIYEETSSLILDAVNIEDGVRRLECIKNIQPKVNEKKKEFENLMKKYLQIG